MQVWRPTHFFYIFAFQVNIYTMTLFQNLVSIRSRYQKLHMPQLLHSSLGSQFPWWLWGEDAIPPFVLHYVAWAHIKGMVAILLHFLNTPPNVSQYAQETGHMQSGRASSIITINQKNLHVCTQVYFIYTGCRMSQVSAWESWPEIQNVQIWSSHYVIHSMNFKCEEVPSY